MNVPHDQATWPLLLARKDGDEGEGQHASDVRPRVVLVSAAALPVGDIGFVHRVLGAGKYSLSMGWSSRNWREMDRDVYVSHF